MYQICYSSHGRAIGQAYAYARPPADLLVSDERTVDAIAADVARDLREFETGDGVERVDVRELLTEGINPTTGDDQNGPDVAVDGTGAGLG